MAEDKNKVTRRNFLKASGAVAAGIQIGAVAGAGLAAGKDPTTHTGWQHQGENTQFVDRTKLVMKGKPYEKVGIQRRCDNVESAFGRNGYISRDMRKFRQLAEEEKMNPADDFVRDVVPEGDSGQRNMGPEKPVFPPIEHISEPLQSFYREFPEIYDLDKLRIESILPKKSEDVKKYGDYYTLIEAWSGAWGTSERISQPPEISDFSRGYGRPLPDPVPFKSSKHASRLIKKVTYHFGASMVGIAKLNPDWCYNHSLRGSKQRGSYEVPKHWKYMIAFGVPHQWEQVNSNPNSGTSFDAYARSTIAARRLETYIKNLGYAARRHSPMDGYDVVAVPILVDTGLGQQGRHGIVITPETGSNFRVAFVTTNLELEVDQPIDFGVEDFCKTCKICAEICPSQSISFAETNEGMDTRGYRHWEINQTSCYNYWMQSMGGMGCRLCLIACPYSRKNNWAHALARKVDTGDPTGTVNDGLTWMQSKFFKAPEAEEYLPPPDGHFANFREPPDWLRVSEYLEMNPVKPKKGDL